MAERGPSALPRARLAVLGFFGLLALLWPTCVQFPLTADRYLYDQSARHLLPAADISDRIVVIEVDDRTLQQLGQRWPLPRRTWASFLDRIALFGPRVVALDVVFDSPAPSGELDLGAELLDLLPADDSPARQLVERRMAEGNADRVLSQSMANAGAVVVGAMLVPNRDPLSAGQTESQLRPLAGIDGASVDYRQLQLTQSIAEIGVAAQSHGLLNVPVEDDGRLRRYAFLGAQDQAAFPSLALAAAMSAEPERTDALVKAAAAHDRGTSLLRFGDTRQLRRLAFIDVLLANEESAGLRAALADKIVFVGVTATGVPEQLVTPIGIDTVGVQIHAMAASQLLDDQLIRSRGTPAWLGALVALAIFVLLGAVAGRLPLRWLTALTLASVLGYWLLYYLMFVGPGWALPLAPVTLGALGFLLVELVARVRGLSRERQELLVAQRLADEKTAFIATVTHELRTPLTSIRGSLGLVAGGAVDNIDGEALDMVEIAHSNTQRLIRLVNDVLDLEKLASGNMRFAIADDVDLAALVTSTARANIGFATELGVDIAVDCPDGLSGRGDPERLNQVLTNLISNAVKFSPRGGTVEVSCREHDGGVEFSVRDHGPGIPQAFRDKVFERFAQAGGKGDRHRGTGLGLAIVREIVQRHDGKVWFETEEGAGTTFRVWLPAVSPATSR